MVVSYFLNMMTTHMKIESASLAVHEKRKKKDSVVYILLPGIMMVYSCKLIIMHFNKQKAT